MILNGNYLKEMMISNNLVENANLDNIHSSSYDVTSEDYILRFKKNKKVISFMDVTDIVNMYEQIDIKDGYEFKSGDTIIVPIQDQFNMPNGVCAHLRGRTTFNRLGLFTTIQHINPGYKGKLNISITNHSPNTYLLMPHMQIAQVVFEKLNENVSNDLLYGEAKDKVYQNEDNVNTSHVYADFIGKVVRHFKGNYYYIENVCMDSETKDFVIVYRTLYDRKDSNMWIRPAKMFFEPIDPNREGNITGQTHRFEVVTDLNIDYTKKEN